MKRLLIVLLLISNISVSCAVISADDLITMSEIELLQWMDRDDEVLDTLIQHGSSLPLEKQNLIRKELVSRHFDELHKIFGAATVLQGYDADVTCMAISPNNKLIFTYSDEEASATLWNITLDSDFSRALHCGYEEIKQALFSPDNRFLLVITKTGSLAFWDLNSASSELEFLPGRCAQVTAIAFSGNGLYAISGDKDGMVIVWRVVDDFEPYRFNAAHGKAITTLAMNFDGSVAITCCLDGFAKLLDLSGGSPKIIHIEVGRIPPDLVSFSKDGKRAFISRFTQSSTWNLENPKVEQLSFNQPIALIMAFAFDFSEKLRKRDMPDVRMETNIKQIIYALGIESLFYCSDNGNYAFAKKANSTAEELVICSLKLLYFRPQRIFEHEGRICNMQFSADESMLAIASCDKTVRLWDLNFSHLSFNELILACRLLKIKDCFWQKCEELCPIKEYSDTLRREKFRNAIENYFDVTITTFENES